jgi:hypothetical protein
LGLDVLIRLLSHSNKSQGALGFRNSINETHLRYWREFIAVICFIGILVKTSLYRFTRLGTFFVKLKRRSTTKWYAWLHTRKTKSKRTFFNAVAVHLVQLGSQYI